MSHRVGTLLVSEGHLVSSGTVTVTAQLPVFAEHLEGLMPTNGRHQAEEAREALRAFEADPTDGRLGALHGVVDGLVAQINYAVDQARTGLILVEVPGAPGDWGYVAKE